MTSLVVDWVSRPFTAGPLGGGASLGTCCCFPCGRSPANFGRPVVVVVVTFAGVVGTLLGINIVKIKPTHSFFLFSPLYIFCRCLK